MGPDQFGRARRLVAGGVWEQAGLPCPRSCLSGVPVGAETRRISRQFLAPFGRKSYV